MTQVRVLSTKAVVLTGVALLLIGVGLAIWFVLAYGGTDNQLEAIKTAGTFVVGGGGAAALYLTARRQRSNELALQQKELDQQQAERTYALQERVAAATEAESQQRRITDSYGAALEQLGSDKPAVRLGSLYALERLAQDNPAQRQMIVNVICAYLRMAPETESSQENEIRGTAHDLVSRHLKRADRTLFWRDIDLDLSGTTMKRLDLSECTVRNVNCTDSRFQEVDFYQCEVMGKVLFTETKLGPADFYGCRFHNEVNFEGATLEGSMHFLRTRFMDNFSFIGALTRDQEVDAGWPPGWHAEPLGPNSEGPSEPGPWFQMVRRT